MNSNSESSPATAADEDSVPLSLARQQISGIWFAGSVIFGAFTAYAALIPHFEGKMPQLVGWASQAVMPTLGLIFSVMAANAVRSANAKDQDLHVNRMFFFQAKVASIIYFVFLVVCLAWAMAYAPVKSTAARTAGKEVSATSLSTSMPLELEAAPGRTPADRAEALTTTNTLLGVAQGAVGLLIGAMFFSKEKKTLAVAAPRKTRSSGSPGAVEKASEKVTE